MPVISLALLMRVGSQKGRDYGNQLLAGMRQAFGGRDIKTANG